MSNLSNSEPINQEGRRKYDDITYEKRCQLIELIEEEKWTIKSAAKEIGIKLCTAKHILYLYRRKGKIYRKKGELQEQDEENNQEDNPTPNIQYYPIFIIPFPMFIPQKIQQPQTLTPNLSQVQQIAQPERLQQYGAFRPL